MFLEPCTDLEVCSGLTPADVYSANRPTYAPA